MSDGQFFRDAVLNASRLVECSLFTLLLMFGWTLTHFAERFICYLRAGHQTRQFLKERETSFERGEWGRILVSSESLTNSHVATVYSRGLWEFHKYCDCMPFEQSLETAVRVTWIARNEMHEQLKRGLNSVSAISRTAPLVGLFGTCIGILDSFRGYAGDKYGYLAFLVTNLAEALVPTTVGLLVAVVATWSFNWQSDRVAVLAAEMEIASSDLVGHLKRHKMPTP